MPRFENDRVDFVPTKRLVLFGGSEFQHTLRIRYRRAIKSEDDIAGEVISDTALISDIYLDGAISEVATRRSEFAAILKSDGIDGLIAALNRKADILTGTAARSF